MITRQTPFKNISHLELAKYVVEQQLRPDVPNACPKPIAELIRWCWDPIPSKRPNFEEIYGFLEHTRVSFGEVR